MFLLRLEGQLHKLDLICFVRPLMDLTGNVRSLVCLTGFVRSVMELAGSKMFRSNVMQ